MGSPARTRTRKTAQTKVKAEAKDPEITIEEADLAAAQESNELQQATINYLQQRVGLLRVQLNRANKEVDRLKSLTEGD